jgi:hypothetical protein
MAQDPTAGVRCVRCQGTSWRVIATRSKLHCIIRFRRCCFYGFKARTIEMLPTPEMIRALVAKRGRPTARERIGAEPPGK